MTTSSYLATRWQRGLSLKTLGPNEARLLFDAAHAIGAAAAAAAFAAAFADGPTADLLGTPLLPAAFLAAAAALGVYGRFRIASTWIKVTALTGAAVIAALVSAAAGVPLAVLWPWLAMTLPPVAMARVILSLPYSRSSHLTTLVVNRHGPVVVIGGAGYIGSQTVDLLLSRGFKVRVLDRLMYGQSSIEPFLAHPNFELIVGDVTDIARLAQALRGAAAVVHLAGLVGDPACAVDTEFTRHTNIIATRMAKEVTQGLGIHRFVFASSCSVYGVSDDEVREGDALNPVSLYAQTKIDAENELLFNVRDDFFVTILRFATVFGHSRRPRFDLVVNLFTAQALVNGEVTVIGPDQWRPFIHVRDLARAIVLTLDAEPNRIQSQIFNVGDQRLNMTIGQLGETVQRVCSQYRSIKVTTATDSGDSRNYAVSFDKIRRDLGFEATVLMDEGVREMAEHIVRHDYGDFRDPAYSNVLTTQQVLHEFYDSAELGHLYGPLSPRQAHAS